MPLIYYKCHAMPHLIAAIFVFLFISTAESQPGPRHLEEVVYDTGRNRLILFGGVELQKEKWIEPSSVHEWDGNNWTLSEAPGPIGRRAGGLVYDASTKETLLFGGVTTGKVQPDSVLLDAWSWDGTNWKNLNTTCPVKEPEAAYDPVNKRILVYGDANNKTIVDYNLPAAFELWAYKNDGWKKLSADGPNIRGSGKISFDVARNKLVVPVFNENKLTVWEWSDAGWTKTECGKDCPGYRNRFAIAYQPVEKATYLFGGLSAARKELGDFWKWDGRQWTKIDFTGGPSMRNSAHFVFGSNELLLYGGTIPKSPPEKGSKLCSELWSWKKGKWVQYNYNDIAPAFKYAPFFSAIIVKNVDTSTAWYQAVFDMKIKNRINDTERGFRVVIMEHSSFLLELIENKSWPDQKQLLFGKPDGTRIQGFFKIGFSVTDLDSCLKHLAFLKIIPDRIYTDSETKKRNFLIEDPDKNLIQFFE